MADKSNPLIDWMAARYGGVPKSTRTIEDYLRESGMVEIPPVYIGRIALFVVREPVDRNVTTLIEKMWLNGAEVIATHDYRIHGGPLAIAIDISALTRLVKED